MLLRAAKVMAAGLPGGTSFMEDYTYHLVPGEEKVLGAHMLEVCPIDHDRQPSPGGPPAVASAVARTRCGCASPPTPAAAVVAGLSDLGDRFRLTVNEIDVVEPDEELPQLPVACAVWEPRPSLSTSAEAWLMAGAPHHTVLSKAVGVEVLEDFAEMTGIELVVIDADTTTRAVPAGAALERGVPPAGRRYLTAACRAEWWLPRTLQSGPCGPDCDECSLWQLPIRRVRAPPRTPRPDGRSRRGRRRSTRSGCAASIRSWVVVTRLPCLRERT